VKESASRSGNAARVAMIRSRASQAGLLAASCEATVVPIAFVLFAAWRCLGVALGERRRRK